jgi:hypothetical protein
MVSYGLALCISIGPNRSVMNPESRMSEQTVFDKRVNDIPYMSVSGPGPP